MRSGIHGTDGKPGSGATLATVLLGVPVNAG